jgi:GDP-4-dehydro-6-deoxy-D-mannose reductase
MRTLVTGARGFAGRHLLGELGEDAVAARIDVTDVDATLAEVEAAQPNAVAHLAAVSSVGESLHGGPEVWRVNVLGTVNVLDAVRTARPRARVLVVSSGEVYGPTASGPADEEQQLAPLSPYAASKAAAELACGQAAREHGLDIVIARAFPHTGPGQDGRFAIGSWTRQIARLEERGGGTLEVGDLTVERDLTDVRDVVRAYRLLLEPAVPAGVYNIASGRAIALAEVVELLIGLARCPVEIRQNPARIRHADVAVLAGDPSKLEAATGWRPEIPLEQTLADALDEARRKEQG